MATSHASITVKGPEQQELIDYLRKQHVAAYASAPVKGASVIFQEDLATQADLASAVSAHFSCPALLVLDYAGKILLYELFVHGRRADAYVSEPHDELDLGGEEAPRGDAVVLCGAFDAERFERRVETILRKPTHPSKGYALAENRHGELARALGLPTFAVGASFAAIELGELPWAEGFNPDSLTRTQ